jgi:hypothetical protein
MSKDEKIARQREALLHLLEVQVRPSTEYEAEWQNALNHARAVVREIK